MPRWKAMAESLRGSSRILVVDSEEPFIALRRRIEMKLFLQIRKAIPILACSILTAVPVLASPIFVSNFSFENLPPGGLPNGCGTGCSYSDGAIPGWSETSVTSSVGQFQPGV